MGNTHSIQEDAQHLPKTQFLPSVNEASTTHRLVFINPAVDPIAIQQVKEREAARVKEQEFKKEQEAKEQAKRDQELKEKELKEKELKEKIEKESKESELKKEREAKEKELKKEQEAKVKAAKEQAAIAAKEKEKAELEAKQKTEKEIASKAAAEKIAEKAEKEAKIKLEQEKVEKVENEEKTAKEAKLSQDSQIKSSETSVKNVEKKIEEPSLPASLLEAKPAPTNDAPVVTPVTPPHLLLPENVQRDLIQSVGQQEPLQLHVELTPNAALIAQRERLEAALHILRHHERVRAETGMEDVKKEAHKLRLSLAECYAVNAATPLQCASLVEKYQQLAQRAIAAQFTA